MLFEELKLLARSRQGLIALRSADECRVEGLLGLLADTLGLPLFTWKRTTGLIRHGESGPVYGTSTMDATLRHIMASPLAAMYELRGAEGLLNAPATTERLQDVAGALSERGGVAFLTGHGVEIPPALRQHTAVLDLPAPTEAEYLDLLKRLLRDLGARRTLRIDISGAELRSLLANLRGLTMLEAEKVLTRAIIVDEALTADDIRGVVEAKRTLVEREGLLEYYPVENTLADVVGLQALKGWLDKRRQLIADPQAAERFGLPFPKGILMVGIPGSGKSLCAKAVAMSWALPLLKMDPARLYNKYVGETEKNFRRALDTAEKMAPVVLWIDEIEKALTAAGGDGEDGGVSQRALGMLLTWLQERAGDVFVVATANDVSRLPAELLRKGRFDEIFFIDLPRREARGGLFAAHLRKRRRDPASFDLGRLAQASEGFTGAEIEQVVVSGLYTAFAGEGALTTDTLLEELRLTRPLSRTAAEKMAWLRDWARERTVPADGPAAGGPRVD